MGRLMPGGHDPTHAFIATMDGNPSWRPGVEKVKAGGWPVNVGGAVIGTTGVVVAGCVDHGDAGIGKPGQFACQDSLGSNGEPLVVEQVAGDQESIGALLKRQVHQCAKRIAACLLKLLAQCRVVPPKRRVEVNVGRMNKLEGRVLAMQC